MTALNSKKKLFINRYAMNQSRQTKLTPTTLIFSTKAVLLATVSTSAIYKGFVGHYSRFFSFRKQNWCGECYDHEVAIFFLIIHFFPHYNSHLDL